MAGLLSTAISGLQASQNALRTAGHNIANANTEGYSRQRVEYGTRPAQTIGSAGYLGNGVNTESINRVVDGFVSNQLRLDTSNFHQFDSFNTNIGKIDNLLADANTGLAAGLESFFSTLQSASDDPASTPARQLVLDEADGLATRFNTLYDRFNSIENGLHSEIDIITGKISTLSNSIAELNRSIIQASSADGAQPNDLLDQRDQTLRELSELVSTRVVQQGDGQMNVYIGNGQPLVVGPNASQLGSDQNGHIRFQAASGEVDITDQLAGGKIGGLLRFNEQVLQPVKNELGRVANVMAAEFNRIQSEGIDLGGNYGDRLFADINTPAKMSERVIPQDGAAGDLQARITDTGALTASDYTLRVDSTGAYSVMRESDGTEVASGATVPASPPGVSFDGVTLQYTAPPAAGERYLIQPNARGASNIAAQMTDPEKLALASPVRTGADSGNVGTGHISEGQVLASTDAAGATLPAFATDQALTPPIRVEFTSETTFDVYEVGNPTAVRTGVSFTPGADNPLFSATPGDPSYRGYQASIKGNPVAGDTFTIGFNSDAALDNRNGLKMAGLQNANSVSVDGSGNGLSLTDAYARVVEQVGAKASLARANTDASRSVMEQTDSLRQSISGVNLDEEAADLIKFEQAYNANSQVISIARDVFDTLLGAL